MSGFDGSTAELLLGAFCLPSGSQVSKEPLSVE